MSTRPRKHRRRRDSSEGKRPSPSVVPPGLSGGWYKPLRDPDVVRIHEASLTVLENIGIEVQPSECRDIWQAAGANVDTSKNRVYIPRQLVHNALNSAQNDVFLAGRDPKHDMLLGGQRVYMGTGGAAVKILDLESQRVRETTLQDVADVGRLVDALDNIHFYLRTCVARDIPSEDLDLNTYYAALSSTTKHVTGNCFTVKSLHDVIEMGEMIAGGKAELRERPFLSFVTSWTVSPLRFATETVQVLTEIVRQGMPVFLSSAPQAGATSPAALAGTLVQIHAEELSGITYCQLVKPGTPVVLGYVPSVSDLRTGNFVGGAAEFGLMNSAVAQLGQYCQLPVYNSSGLSDAKLPDVQAGYEKGLTGAVAALAGANYIHHSAGFLESMLTVAYEQFVIDDDINGNIMRLVRGIEVNDETLSLDVIEQVVNGESHFLGTQQSLELMHTEFYYPHTADRQSRDNWQADGGLDMREAARRKARHLLKTHRPTPLPTEIDAAIRERFNILLPL
ncbi:MAG: trimethylamine methyltransferase family protein [Ardenticatenaceae bacterium]|nr:trimethylamine methyltransferase family protein [Anaerolineales bacterium]MCB8940858.1 trimethylamine methyltransferase family protein [Ardenticatenaceae bacterium]MCB8972197.1 trimethylamine methyltransferase family protein [Ardenticatenaceae bacterium]